MTIMSVQCLKYSVTKLLLFALLAHQQFNYIFTANTESVEVPFFFSCQLINDADAYCVPIKNCQIDLKSLNESDLNERRCGPSNENRKNPLVCCETNLVVFSQPKTTTPTSSAKCGVQSIVSNRIIGGETAEEAEFPWLGRILRRDSIAAHCLESKELVENGELYAVSLGEHETSCSSPDSSCLNNKQTIVVSEYVIHPDYDSNSYNHANDISLIILKNRANITDYVSPICLLEKNANVVEYTVSGWGRTNNESSSVIKKKTVIPPYSWTLCSQKYQSVNVTITKKQICAGGVRGKDTCQGDSGGPLMTLKNGRWYAAGVVSIGVGCGTEGWPGIYINIPNYVDWIKEVIRVKNLL
ncbi:phenoloxidase-activating factor 1-like isoform X2 [Tribolium madens]|uniref:phenoloxidase-activating factor 1-like isoform X2 n=1 Tax=Tribolium madens TaxID=41895 RepID=UPI001CF71EC1|nr:phenoloxidase-activating factor 1-like isoform X2 [Tribolium madens]